MGARGGMDEHRGVRLPPELHAVPPRPVEVRIAKFPCADVVTAGLLLRVPTDCCELLSTVVLMSPFAKRLRPPPIY